MAKLIEHIVPALEDYVEAAARTEGVPMDEYAERSSRWGGPH
jgi:hypothetical protein